jgi:ribosomal protein S14
MEFEHSASMLISFDATQAELRRPFYLCRGEIRKHGPDYFEAKYGAVSGFGKTPQIASIAFDLVWLNGSIEKAAVAAAAKLEPNMDAIKTREINILVTENRLLISDRDTLLKLLQKTINVITEFGEITDENRVGWLIAEIDLTLGKHGLPAEQIPDKCPECGTPKGVVHAPECSLKSSRN